MADIRLVIDGAAIAKVLNSPDGPVMRDLIRRATAVQTRAKQIVGVRSGHLRDTIVKRFASSGGRTVILVGSTMPYAYVHHEGSSAHLILPVNAKVLRFEAGGRIVFSTIVHHPGTRANRYLTRAAEEVFRAA